MLASSIEFQDWMFPRVQEFRRCLLRESISLPWHFRYHQTKIQQVLLNTTPLTNAIIPLLLAEEKKNNTLSGSSSRLKFLQVMKCRLYHYTQAWQNTDIFLQSWELLVTGLWPPNQYHHWALLHRSSYTSCPVQLGQHLSLEAPLCKNATLLYKSGPKQELVWKHIISSPGRDLSPKPTAITDNIGQSTPQRWSFRGGRR